MGWYQWLYYQLTCVFTHQTLNFQADIGKGWTGGTYGNGNYQGKTTGFTNAKGHSFGDDTGTNQVKCNFLEDAWGNCWCFVDKIFVDASYNPLLTTATPNDTGANYKGYGRGHTGGASGAYIREIVGTSELGFYPSFVNGSESKYFCDAFWQATNTIAVVGGAWDDGSRAGLFALGVSNPVSYAGVSIGARLCYL